MVKSEHIHTFLFQAEQVGMRQFHDNFTRTDVDSQVLSQIEASFDGKRAVKFYALGASGPGMQQLMLHFDSAGKNHEFARGNALLQINAIIDCDARLQMRDVDKSRS